MTTVTMEDYDRFSEAKRIIEEGGHWKVVPTVTAAPDDPVALERERIRAALARLPLWDKRSVPGGYHWNRAAVLAILDAADREDAP